MQEVIILCRQPGFRRLGIAHPARATYPVDRFTANEMERLLAEPMLEVEVIGEAEAVPAAGDAQAETVTLPAAGDAQTETVTLPAAGDAQAETVTLSGATAPTKKAKGGA